MDFARKILNKYGWKEGDGLGKNSDGIVKPIKASMKFDNAGLGADQAASDFNNHWWERVFNEAASNVEVKSGKNGVVSMDLKSAEDGVEISTKGYSLKKLKKAKASRGTDDARYQNFLQSATLTKAGDEIENPEKIAIADIAVTQYKVLTDEELFQACGGRTAHKGARHGLKLSGKLSRLEQQEQEMLAKLQEKAQKMLTSEEPIIVEKAAKKKKNVSTAEVVAVEEQTPADDELSMPNDITENCDKRTKSKKKKTKQKNDIVEQPVTIIECTDVDTSISSKKKKKKRKSDDVEVSTSEVVKSKKSKKTKQTGVS